MFPKDTNTYNTCFNTGLAAKVIPNRDCLRSCRQAHPHHINCVQELTDACAFLNRKTYIYKTGLKHAFLLSSNDPIPPLLIAQIILTLLGKRRLLRVTDLQIDNAGRDANNYLPSCAGFPFLSMLADILWSFRTRARCFCMRPTFPCCEAPPSLIP